MDLVAVAAPPSETGTGVAVGSGVGVAFAPGAGVGVVTTWGAADQVAIAKYSGGSVGPAVGFAWYCS